MLISGIQRFTMLDYPGKTSCIVFVPGCNFRCGYCHNPEFVLPKLIQKIKDSFIPEENFFKFLNKRQGLLDGVTISGGEPTIMPDLADFIQRIKNMGFLVKIDTNGNLPDRLKTIIDLGLVDYIAMDLKTSSEHYSKLVGPGADKDKINQSIVLIKDSGVPYEFRSTLIRDIHDKPKLMKMAEMISGADKLYLQYFRSGHTLDPAYNKYKPFSEHETKKMAKEIFEPYVREVFIREA
ncbi:anaerobic ribonucleoside-triphosphate reductase activating protein [Patescibacteria group bacterium]